MMLVVVYFQVQSLQSELESLEEQARVYEEQVSGEGTIELSQEEVEKSLSFSVIEWCVGVM